MTALLLLILVAPIFLGLHPPHRFCRQGARLEIPVYFFIGKHGYTTNYDLAHDYFQRLNAPLKGFYTFRDQPTARCSRNRKWCAISCGRTLFREQTHCQIRCSRRIHNDEIHPSYGSGDAGVSMSTRRAFLTGMVGLSLAGGGYAAGTFREARAKADIRLHGQSSVINTSAGALELPSRVTVHPT